jgi:hypothetical protein
VSLLDTFWVWDGAISVHDVRTSGPIVVVEIVEDDPGGKEVLAASAKVAGTAEEEVVEE